MRLSESKVEAQWRSRSRVISPFVVLAVILVFTIGFFGFVPTLGSIRGQNGIYCTLGNHARVGEDPNAINDKWAPSRFLWISLGFGNFSFAAAKGIDVVWDLAVGRGGQLLLIYLTYPIIRRSLLRAMVMFPIRLPMYASIAFDKVSLWTIWAAMRKSLTDSARVQGIQDPVERKGLTILWFLWRYFVIIPILAYILAFPTMMAIMTGYQTEPEPYLLRPGSTGDLMKASLLDIPSLVVLDGSRIGLMDMVAVHKDDTRFATLSNCMVLTSIMLRGSRESYLSF